MINDPFLIIYKENVVFFTANKLQNCMHKFSVGEIEKIEFRLLQRHLS